MEDEKKIFGFKSSNVASVLNTRIDSSLKATIKVADVNINNCNFLLNFIGKLFLLVSID